ncbi:unknown; predicted coding region [Mycoplasmopsis pulmonis]|uniref:Uncharacterized protein n=1 Tax=Mycoplasmopsis pulmonis (strain UAB CTIP) TaxID=272635 RepID=Q98PE6_MYCPU|nr:unknown; predicted coding region [Mycoplasmopsis pulmonis]
MKNMFNITKTKLIHKIVGLKTFLEGSLVAATKKIINNKAAEPIVKREIQINDFEVNLVYLLVKYPAAVAPIIGIP